MNEVSSLAVVGGARDQLGAQAINWGRSQTRWCRLITAADAIRASVANHRHQSNLVCRISMHQIGVEPSKSRKDAIGKPGRGKSSTCIIGPSGGRGAGKINWKPIIQRTGGRPDARNLSAS